MTWVEWLEALSYLITVVGLPLAIAVFIYEKRKERENEEKELNQRLSDEYTSFLQLVIENADLKLLGGYSTDEEWSEEQKERRRVMFEILVSLFERAYLTLYEENMGPQARRRWLSWEDFEREWCRRPDFRAMLPDLLEGEDEEFSQQITRIAEDEMRKAPHPNP